MKHFFKLFFAAAIPFGAVMFAISISNNPWQRALPLAVVFAFLFGSLFAQIMTFRAEKKKQNRKKEEQEQKHN
jgi:fluoride ion exporter CrcB/FEX